MAADLVLPRPASAKVWATLPAFMSWATDLPAAFPLYAKVLVRGLSKHKKLGEGSVRIIKCHLLLVGTFIMTWTVPLAALPAAFSLSGDSHTSSPGEGAGAEIGRRPVGGMHCPVSSTVSSSCGQTCAHQCPSSAAGACWRVRGSGRPERLDLRGLGARGAAGGWVSGLMVGVGRLHAGLHSWLAGWLSA
jgi:hypothetical protein